MPGIYFAGTIGQGCEGPPEARHPGQLRGRPGLPLQRPGPRRAHRAGRGSAWRPRDPAIDARRPRRLSSPRSSRTAPELWHQRAYLARVVTLDPTVGIRDEGILPLAWFVDASGPDALAITLEADGSGDVYPVLYTRIAGRLAERRFEAHPLLDYRTATMRRAITEILDQFGSGIR